MTGHSITINMISSSKITFQNISGHEKSLSEKNARPDKDIVSQFPFHDVNNRGVKMHNNGSTMTIIKVEGNAMVV